jgi:hypothetical protein
VSSLAVKPLAGVCLRVEIFGTLQLYLGSEEQADIHGFLTFVKIPEE